MTNKELYELLLQTDLKVAYNHFKSKVEPPFIIYDDNNPETFVADDKVYKKINSYEIYLITDKKDIELEEQLEELLNDNHLPFDKTSLFIQDEQIYQIGYTI